MAEDAIPLIERFAVFCASRQVSDVALLGKTGQTGQQQNNNRAPTPQDNSYMH
jgi:hypothetical protein